MTDQLRPEHYVQPCEYIATSNETLPEIFTEHTVARLDGLQPDQVTMLTIVQPDQRTDVGILTNRADIICMTVLGGMGSLVVREYHEGNIRLTEHTLRAGDELGVGPDIQFYLEAGDDGLVVRDTRLASSS